jgi:DNA recombination protein RmuC
MTMLIFISAVTSFLTSVLVCILMFTGRAAADLTPMYQTLREGRDELRSILGGQSQALDARLNNVDVKLGNAARQQTDELWGVAQRITGSLTGGLENVRKENEAKLEAVRNTVAAGLKDNETWLNLVRTTVTEALDKVRQENETKLEAIRGAVTTSLDKVRQDNEAKLEQMRQTVDERLQTTLETRLSENFKTVSEQLLKVHQGLGEMKDLANDVGNLQRALTT